MPITKKKKRSGKKKPQHANTRGTEVSWDGMSTKQQGTCTLQNFLLVVGFLLVVVMINLYFFVESPEVPTRQAPTKTQPQAKNFTRAPKKPMFYATEEIDASRLHTLISSLENRIMVVAFEEANVEGSKKSFWKRWERIGRTLPNKKAFKRADEDDLPLIVRFDCSFEQKKNCEQLVGPNNLPSVLMWKEGSPRRIAAEDIRTDTMAVEYLARQLQEAVQYQESLEEAELFVTEEGLQVMFFGKDESGEFRLCADMMRDLANFGRTNVPDIAEAFDAEMPSLRMYRGFDESPIMYTSNITDNKAMQSWVIEHSVPLFGEWTNDRAKIKRYDAKKLPVVWIAVDPTEDDTVVVLEAARKLATEHWGEYQFTQLDAIMNADAASQMGVTELPMTVLFGKAELRKKIDVDAPEESILGAIADWKDAVDRPPEENPDLDDEYEDEDYDEGYEDGGYDEDDEDDFDAEEEEEISADDEEEKEEL